MVLRMTTISLITSWRITLIGRFVNFSNRATADTVTVASTLTLKAWRQKVEVAPKFKGGKLIKMERA